MNQQRKPDSADTPYRSLHLSPEELIQLPPDELLEACLEMRRLLDLIMGVLSTPDSTLIMRAVTIDLLSSEAERLSRQQGAGEELPVTYHIKTVSQRLGIRPASVRQAYEQLDALGAVHIVARQFPPRRERQRALPLDETGTGKSEG
jgi:CRP-like cAMP-binding protein